MQQHSSPIGKVEGGMTSKEMQLYLQRRHESAVKDKLVYEQWRSKHYLEIQRRQQQRENPEYWSQPDAKENETESVDDIAISPVKKKQTRRFSLSNSLMTSAAQKRSNPLTEWCGRIRFPTCGTPALCLPLKEKTATTVADVKGHVSLGVALLLFLVNLLLPGIGTVLLGRMVSSQRILKQQEKAKMLGLPRIKESIYIYKL